MNMTIFILQIVIEVSYKYTQKSVNYVTDTHGVVRELLKLSVCLTRRACNQWYIEQHPTANIWWL